MKIPLISKIMERLEKRTREKYLQMKKDGICIRCQGKGMILVSPCFSMLCDRCKGSGIYKSQHSDVTVKSE